MSTYKLEVMLKEWGRDSEAWLRRGKTMTGVIAETAGVRVDGGSGKGLAVERNPVSEKVEEAVVKMGRAMPRWAELLKLIYVHGLGERRIVTETSWNREQMRRAKAGAEGWLLCELFS